MIGSTGSRSAMPDPPPRHRSRRTTTPIDRERIVRMTIKHSLKVRDRAIVIEVVEAIECSWIQWICRMKRLQSGNRTLLPGTIRAKNPDEQQSERQRVHDELPREGSPQILDGEEHLW